MQTILGANGQIGTELAKAVHANYSKDLRLVSRSPKKIHASDEVYSADLMNAVAASDAIKGSDIVYFTVGLPMDSDMWEDKFPTILANVIDACEKHQAKLVFFDNTYMYPKTAEPQTESIRFEPKGRKSTVRADMANQVLNAMQQQRITAMICRAPEFYGADETQSITNTLVFDNIKAGKAAKVPLNAHAKRSLIWAPDASRATALLGNTPEAYGQTWHLPIESPITYHELIDIAETKSGHSISYKVLKPWMFKIGGLFNKTMKELQELLPRYRQDNIFVDDKFRSAFPDFKTTSLEEGVQTILTDKTDK